MLKSSVADGVPSLGDMESRSDVGGRDVTTDACSRIICIFLNPVRDPVRGWRAYGHVFMTLILSHFLRAEPQAISYIHRYIHGRLSH